LGFAWTHTYARSIEYLPGSDPNSAAKTAIVSRPEGGRVSFHYINGQWQADADVLATLIQRLDVQGALLGWTYTPVDGREVEYYDVLGRLAQITRSDGTYVALIYNNGAIEGGARDYCPSRVEAQDGRALVFVCDNAGRIAGITDPAGSNYAYAYDSSGRLQSVTYPDGMQRTYLVNESAYLGGASMKNALTGIQDEDSQRFATFTYDSQGRAVSTEHAGGVEKYSIAYTSDEAVVITGPLGHTDTRSFGTVLGLRRALSSVEQCADCVTRNLGYTYDENGRIDVATDAAGSMTDYDYDDRGLLVQEKDASSDAFVNRTRQTDWHAGFSVPLARRTYNADAVLLTSSQWTYNARAQPLTATRTEPASGAVRATTMAYCEQVDVDAGTCPRIGLVVSIDGPRTDASDLTTYTYYPTDDAACSTTSTICSHRRGDLHKVTNALGQVTEYLRYDGAGRVLSTKDPRGVITDYEYHPRGWLTANKVRGADDASEVDDRITRIEYWPTGLVKQITQPDGAFIAFTYDAAHRLTDIVDNAGNILHYTLDNAGNRIKEDTGDAGGALKHTLSRVYNQLGQLKTQATAVGDPTDFAYDANGNTTSLSDALSRTTLSGYDPLNRLSRTLQDIDGIRAETQFKYDALDNITQVTDPKGLQTRYEYSGFGEPVKLTSPDTGVTTYTYDSAGNRSSQTDARGITTTYSYDALNRLTKVGYPTSGLDVSYTYDVSQSVCASGETYAVGRLAKMQDGGAITQYCYNRFGDLVRKVQTTNGKSLVLRYAYTSGGRLQQMTYPDGAAVDYVRNAQGQPVEVGVTPPGGNRQVLLTGANYYPFGPSAGWTYGNGRNLQRIYDQDYRPQAIQDARPGGLEIGFGFDPVGDLIALTPAGNATPDITLDYDPLGRLTAFKDGQTGALIDGYTYDATGNRLSAQVNGAVQGYTYPSDSHRLSAVADTARTYDAAGNTTAIGGTARQYVYDATGRMSQARRSGSVTMNYRYNGKGEQVRRFLGSINTYTLHDEAGHWLGDYDGNGAPLQQAIWLDDLPVGLLAAGGQPYYIEPDHLGSPRVVIDPERDVAVWTWSLKGEAFGNTVPDQDPDGDGSAFVLDMRFPGQRFDMASGLNQNIFRDYESGSGRYVESDPIGLKGGRSTYAYALGNPISFTDRLGLITLPQDPSGLPPNWNPDPSHRDPNGERWTNGTDVLDFHRGRPGLPGWRGRDHWHHDEGDKHYAPGEECPTTDDDAPAEDQEFMEKMSKITGLTGTALIMYLIISEGSRLFPPRNLVPVP